MTELRPAEYEQYEAPEAPSGLVLYVLVAFLILGAASIGYALGLATARLW